MFSGPSCLKEDTQMDICSCTARPCQESPESTVDIPGIRHPDVAAVCTSQILLSLLNNEDSTMPVQHYNATESHAVSFFVNTVWGGQTKSLERRPPANHMVHLLLLSFISLWKLKEYFSDISACVYVCARAPVGLVHFKSSSAPRETFFLPVECDSIWFINWTFDSRNV